MFTKRQAPAIMPRAGADPSATDDFGWSER